MTAISPRMSQAIESIRQDRTHGASWLARDAVNVLTHWLDECPAQTVAEFLSCLREVATALAEALKVERPRRPTKPTAGSKVRRLDAKAKRSDTKSNRRRPAGDD